MDINSGVISMWLVFKVLGRDDVESSRSGVLIGRVVYFSYLEIGMIGLK